MSYEQPQGDFLSPSPIPAVPVFLKSLEASKKNIVKTNTAGIVPNANKAHR